MELLHEKGSLTLCKYYVRACGGSTSFSNFECNPSYFLRQCRD